MTDQKDQLPSDSEDGGLKPRDGKRAEPAPPPEDKEVEKDPSEQPS